MLRVYTKYDVINFIGLLASHQRHSFLFWELCRFRSHVKLCSEEAEEFLGLAKLDPNTPQVQA